MKEAAYFIANLAHEGARQETLPDLAYALGHDFAVEEASALLDEITRALPNLASLRTIEGSDLLHCLSRPSSWGGVKGFESYFGLLQKGFDLESIDGKGNTVLFKLALHGQSAFVRMALELGANPNAQNAAGKTALYYADAKTIPVLLEFGADPLHIDADGFPLLFHVASFPKNEDRVDLLLKAGAYIDRQDLLEKLSPCIAEKIRASLHAKSLEGAVSPCSSAPSPRSRL